MSLVHTSSASANADTNSLPKLPIPPLETTLEKYEKTLQPLLNDEQKHRLHKIIQDFGKDGGIGRKLQLYLINRQEKLDNWAFKYWLEDMYFTNPLALPVNSNPGCVYPTRKFTTILDVARFGARIIDGALNYKAILDKRELPIEKCASREPGQPLCMEQYYCLLGSCRIPGKFIDSQYKASKVAAGEIPTEHIVVMCRSQIYCVPIQASDRGRLSEDEICAQLLHILDDAPNLTNPAPIGLLTGIQRRNWGEARDALCRDDKNRHNLDLIVKSLLLICLDEPLPSSFNCRVQRVATKGAITAGSRDETNICLQMIHGGGSSYNSGNRWFDKTLQFVVTGDGSCGFCYEHSEAEGMAILDIVAKIFEHVDALPSNTDVPATAGSHLPPPERLEWVLEQDDHQRIEAAATFIDNLAKDLDFQVFRFVGYGKDFMKSCKVSPDVYVQLALQLAYYRLYGKLTATYESASTRRFRLGRVDCIRSCSPEALAWVTAMSQPKDDEKKVTFHLISDETKLKLWLEAVKQQTNEMVDNILGQGIDIHLLGLREAAKETSPTAAHPLPEIFTDESYRIANRFLLSTSQLTTTGHNFGGYGPVEPEGYGAAYNLKCDQIIFSLSAFWSSENTSSSKFAQSLEESLNAMQSLLKIS